MGIIEKHITRANRVDIKKIRNKTSVTLSHQFADNTARDTYFTTNPTELVDNLFIKIGLGYQQYINGVWHDTTAIISEHQTANQMPIDDAGNHYISGNVEGALQEVSSELSNLATQKADRTELTELESLVTNVIDGEIQNVLNNELVATDIANKLNAKEVEYAPRLTSVEAQINSLDAKFLNNAGAHNSIYRGKYLGNAVTAKQYADIANGTFEDMYIGDYWKRNGTDYIIAAFNYYMGVGDVGVTANHITLVPRVALYNHVMNDTNTTTGGYMGSKMYTGGLNQAKTKILADFTGRVLKHRKLLSNAISGEKVSGWAWVDSEVDLMNEVMVYGSNVWGQSTIGGSGYNVGEGKSQLPLFRLRPDMISMRSHSIWMRDVVSASLFAYVSALGSASCNDASYALGVRPAFSIS